MPEAKKAKNTTHSKHTSAHKATNKTQADSDGAKSETRSDIGSAEHTVNKTSVEQDQNIKTIAALAYLIFFLPMITNKDSKFAMYHANQGLVLLLTFLVLSFLFNVLGAILFFFGGFLLWSLPGLIAVVLGVLGIVNALNGEMKPLPIVGEIKLLK